MSMNASISSGHTDTESGSAEQNVKVASKSIGNSSERERSTQAGGIVTVHAGPGADDDSMSEDTVALLNQIRNVALCYPLLPSSVGLVDKFSYVEMKSLGDYFLRLQENLRQCAAAVAFDQAGINSRIREIGGQMKALTDAVAARHKYVARASQQFSKSRELAADYSRVHMRIEAAAKLADKLNQLLPAHEQLEPFAIAPYSVGSIND